MLPDVWHIIKLCVDGLMVTSKLLSVNCEISGYNVVSAYYYQLVRCIYNLLAMSNFYLWYIYITLDSSYKLTVICFNHK